MKKTSLIVTLSLVLLSTSTLASNLYVNSANGRVGISTTSPQSLLHVYSGEVQVGSSGTACSATIAGAMRYATGSAYVCDGTNWSLMGGTNGGALPVLANGSLWVGNASNVATAVTPSGDCTITNAGVITCTKTSGVAFGSLATQFGVNLSTQASGTLQAAQFPALTGDVTTTAGSVATTVAKIQGTAISGTTGTGNAVLSASPTLTGTVTGASANWSGNVGIGTTSPTVALDVQASGVYSASFKGTSTGPSGLVHIENTNTATSWNLGVESGSGWSSGAAGTLYIDKNNVGPMLVIAPSGNVGVGTTTPASPLTVNGAIQSLSGGFKFPDGTTQTTAAGTITPGSVGSLAAAYINSTTIQFTIGSVYSAATIRSTIGTTDPNYFNFSTGNWMCIFYTTIGVGGWGGTDYFVLYFFQRTS